MENRYEIFTKHSVPVLAKTTEVVRANQAGEPAWIGTTALGQGGVVLNNDGSLLTIDVGRSIYNCQIAVTLAVANGTAVFYNNAATSAPFLSTDGAVGKFFGYITRNGAEDAIIGKATGTHYGHVILTGGFLT